MIKYQVYFLFLSLLCAGLASCDIECQDCSPIPNTPFVNAVFIDQRGIATLEPVRELTTSKQQREDSINTLLNDSIGVLNDSLSALQIGLDSGNTGLNNAFRSVENQIEEVTLEQQMQQTLLDSLSDVISDLSQQILNKENGLLQLNSLRANAGSLQSSTVTFTDSMSVYALTFPGDTAFRNITYDVNIANTVYQFTIDYKSDIILDASNVLQTRISDIRSENVTSTSFDSLLVQCQDPDSICISDETQIILYF